MYVISVKKSSPDALSGAPMFKNKKQNHSKSTLLDPPVVD